MRIAIVGNSDIVKFRPSLFLSALGRYGSLTCLLVSLMALSRLLTPEEFGIYSVIMALPGLAQTLRDCGGANYLIQARSITNHSIRTAFTVTFCMCALLAGVLFLVRDAAARFFGQPAIVQGIAVSSLNFVLLPFWVIVSALLRREMAFSVITICVLAGDAVIAATSVGLAAFGYGYMGPVWGWVAGNLALTLLFVGYRRDFSIFRPCLRSWREVLSFGSYSAGTVTITTLYDWAPPLILGRVVGFTAAGLYGRALNIVRLFDRLVVDVLNPVILPAISAQSRSGADLKPIFLNATALLTALQWPFFLFVALMADPIVMIVFGNQWTDVIPLIRMLAVASLAMFAACLTYPVLVAAGGVRDTLIVALISVAPSLVVMLVAAFFGLKVVAASAFVTLPLQGFVALHFIRERVGFRWRELVRAVRKSAVVAACTVLCTGAALAANDFRLAISTGGFLSAALAGSGGWWLGLLVTRHPLLTELNAALARLGELWCALGPLVYLREKCRLGRRAVRIKRSQPF